MPSLALRLAASVVVATALIGCVLAARALPAEAASLSIAPFEGSAHVVNGVMTPVQPAVGALLAGNDPDAAGAWCSGTLIGCRTFLTAAHCVCPGIGKECQGTSAPLPSDYLVFFQHAGFHVIEKIEVHPDYAFPAADLAVITLLEPVVGVIPLPISTGLAPEPGSPATIVGFGRSGGDEADYGLKRSGSVVIGQAPSDSTGLIWWYFNGPLGTPGSNSNTCNGDSGGPLLLESDEGAIVAGVTSGGHRGDCLTGDASFDTDVASYTDWITARGELADDDPCTATVETDASTLLEFHADGVLDEVRTQEQLEFEVPPGSVRLRIGFNAIGDGRSDFNFSAGPANVASSASACRRDGPGQYGFCEWNTPAVGTWEISIDRVAGAGPYQVMATAVVADCTNPAQEDSPCNDGDPCTQGDVCARGVCGGTFAYDDDLCPYQSPLECPPEPILGCWASPERARTSLRWDDPLGSRGFTWRWSGRASSESLDPTVNGAYFVCVYGDTPENSQLLGGARIPTGSSWQQSSRGFILNRERGGTDGAVRARLRKGRHDRVSLAVEAADAEPVPLAAIAGDRGQLTIQFHHHRGCWQTQP